MAGLDPAIRCEWKGGPQGPPFCWYLKWTRTYPHSVNSKGDPGNFIAARTEKRIVRCIEAERFNGVQTEMKSTEYASSNAVGHNDTRNRTMIGNAAQGAIQPLGQCLQILTVG
jgi:hypothetical protein